MTSQAQVQPLAAAEPIPAQKLKFTSTALLARNATLNLATNGWIFLVLVFAMPKLVHALGEASFGLFSLAWVMVGYLTFLDVGVNRAATKFISEHLAEGDHESAEKIARTAIFANLAMGVAGGVATALLSPFLVHSVFKISGPLETEARWVFYAVGLAVPVLLLQGVFRAALSSFQRFGWINGVDALATGGQWLAACLLAWKGYGAAIVVFSTVLARLVATTAYGAVLSRSFPGLRLFRTENLHGLVQLLRFGGWVSVSQIISPILVYLDRVMIASFASLTAVTLYTVPFEAMTRLRVIPSALVGTLYPAFSERGGSDQSEQLGALYASSVRYLTLVLTPGIVYLLVLGSDLFHVWMGPSFAQQTSTVLRVLALGIFANSLAPLPYSLLQALGRPDLTGKFHLAELPLYVALCALLIPRWGLMGAAVASTIRFVLDAALLFWAATKYCRCSLRDFWMNGFPRIVLLGCLQGLLLFGVTQMWSAPWARIVAGVVVVAASLLGAWFFAINGEEKPRIIGIVRHMLSQTAR